MKNKHKANPNWSNESYSESGAFTGEVKTLQKRVRALDFALGKKHEALCREVSPGEFVYLIKEIGH